MKKVHVKKLRRALAERAGNDGGKASKVGRKHSVMTNLVGREGVTGVTSAKAKANARAKAEAAAKSGQGPPKTHKEALQRLYKRVDPGKLQHVDKIVATFAKQPDGMKKMWTVLQGHWPGETIEKPAGF